VTVVLPTLPHTLKGTDVSLVGYRTEANPTFDASFYRVTNPDPSDTSGANCYVANSLTADTISFVDEMPDTTLITKELDYQNSGELQNICATSPAVLCHGADRLFSAAAGSLDTVTHSKLHFDGDAVAYSDEYDPITADRFGGPVTAIASLNDNVIVFKASRIYFVEGDGPSNLGTGSWSPTREITADCGCIDQRSVVSMPNGLMFQSEKGFYLLGGDFSVTYVGADVERYNSQTFTGATLMADRNQVLFLASDGKSLLYDYYFKQWSTWSNYEGEAAILWKGAYCRLGSDGKVYKESTGYHDAGAEIRRIVKTAPIKNPFSAQGYMRVRYFEILGEYKSPHRMRVTVFFNYEPGMDSYSFEWNPADAMNVTAYGDGLYGDGYYGGAGSAVYQLGHETRMQKCQSIQIQMEDIPELPPGESCILTEVMLEVGLKGGGMRLVNSKET
jgi:hypothetical protein